MPDIHSFWHDRGVPETPSTGQPAQDDPRPRRADRARPGENGNGSEPVRADPAWADPSWTDPAYAERGRRGRRAAPETPADDYWGPSQEPSGEWTSEAQAVTTLPPANEPVHGPSHEPSKEGADEPARVRRFLSLGIAGFAALLTVGLVVGAQTTHGSYAVVVFGVQALFVVVWTVASRPPAPRVVAAVGLLVAVATDVSAVWTRPASLAPLAYVTAAGFIVGVVGQLTRRRGRMRVTESLASSLVVTLGVVSFAMLIVLGRIPRGTQALEACLVAAGVAIIVARLVDVVAAVPRVAPQVPRGGAGVVLGAMIGTGAAGIIGHLLDGIPNLQTAIAGLITAIVAVMVDLSVGYAEASRQIDGDAPALWLARHIQGPLGAFAFAAPAIYAASALLLL